ncbi:MAG: membrane-bound lytic murein transglycosylase MltF [Arenicellales bacterium]|nr:membrane-bound lytic murein transglycosylase MltF [Arenicellales bacterium]
MTDPDRPPLYKTWTPLVFALITLGALPLFLVYDRPREVALEDIKETGILKVLTINSPTTYYEGPEHPLGLEYDLVKGIAKKLDVELVMETTDTVASILPRLTRGDAHFAAAGLIVTKEREQLVRFTPAYQEIQQQAVYLRGGTQPRTIEDLIGREIKVVSGSSVAQRLSELKSDHPELKWEETSEKTAEDLLYDVWTGELDLTISDSNIIAVVRQHHPELHTGVTIKESEKLAWAFPPTSDDSVFNAASEYLKELNDSGELKSLLDRYYGTADSFNYINVSKFRQRVSTLLPNFEDLFKQAGEESGIDWRLIAAQAYQESQWNPKAVSPTGVKGMMQLTQDTADFLKIENREDPVASVMGGAKFLKQLSGRLPERITEPDRTWLALASYNIGFGHLEDARVLTDKSGKNPDKWADVKEFLPYLAKPEWYEQTKYGQARGEEALAYVSRIRTFYDVLVKMSVKQKPELLKLDLPAL